MEIVIVRGDPKPWGIDGHLYINRKRICDTVEHPTHHMPQGEYQITLPFRGEGLCPIGQPVAAHRTLSEVGFFPFRHGDGALSLKHGEIIVGKHLLPGVVTASQPTYDRLYERLKKAFQRGTPVRLTIRG